MGIYCFLRMGEGIMNLYTFRCQDFRLLEVMNLSPMLFIEPW